MFFKFTAILTICSQLALAFGGYALHEFTCDHDHGSSNSACGIASTEEEHHHHGHGHCHRHHDHAVESAKADVATKSDTADSESVRFSSDSGHQHHDSDNCVLCQTLSMGSMQALSSVLDHVEPVPVDVFGHTNAFIPAALYRLDLARGPPTLS
ncbi:hypothetical protein [Calycomorphotria hydatis]|uniref:Cobalt-zinc-cadmium resistance protein CzcI n=1 Tax=Calycomorphotria hydatis TaxID=2528027 RepID=A0A517TA20_9PLAN|nr:hypothetical protein [Calycomorphotria hydatis]QDT65217.1 hypothetical protein V22_24640 [Calycomorphotria hydatis]